MYSKSISFRKTLKKLGIWGSKRKQKAGTERVKNIEGMCKLVTHALFSQILASSESEPSTTKWPAFITLLTLLDVLAFYITTLAIHYMLNHLLNY